MACETRVMDRQYSSTICFSVLTQQEVTTSGNVNSRQTTAGVDLKTFLQTCLLPVLVQSLFVNPNGLFKVMLCLYKSKLLFAGSF